MIVGLLLAGALAGGSLPREITIAGLRGEVHIAVRLDGAGFPVIPAAPLIAALEGQIRLDSTGWAEVVVSRQPFRFLVGAPLYQFSNQLLPLAGPASLSRDSLFLPYQFVAEIVPYYLGERYRWDAAGARLRSPPACRTAFAPATSSRWTPATVVWIRATRASSSPGARMRRKSPSRSACCCATSSSAGGSVFA